MTFICSTCKKILDRIMFHNCKSLPNGIYPICKPCRQVSSKRYRDKHGDKIRAQWRAVHRDNPHRHRENARRYQRENWEMRKSYMRQWTKNNAGKANAHTAKRYAAKTCATPPWLSKPQLKDIEWFYVTAKELQWLSDEPLHVDHIEPLRGDISCGLHVPWNLRIVPASINLAKSNRLEAPA